MAQELAPPVSPITGGGDKKLRNNYHVFGLVIIKKRPSKVFSLTTTHLPKKTNKEIE